MLTAPIDVKPSALITGQQAVRDCVALCKLFHKVQGQDVSVIQQSARDRLLRKEPDVHKVLGKCFRIKLEESHPEPAQTCLEYLGNGGV